MVRELSYKIIRNYVLNYFKFKFQKNPIFKPWFFTYYITLNCNFNCCYCDFANTGENKKRHKELNTQDSIRLLEIIRKECPYIYFTGGEPLLRHDIVEISKKCKQMGFKSISINTNMSLIHKKIEVLDHITNLVSSFDVVDENKNTNVVGMPSSVVHQVKKNILLCAKLQQKKDFLMTVNCVVTDKTIENARNVMDFCFKHNIRYAIVPGELHGGRINPKLKGNKQYQELIKDVIKAKEQGLPVFNSLKYLETVHDFKRFDCYPTLTPHVYPQGELFYPCQPLKEVAANLLELGSYKKALAVGIKKFGNLPMCKDRCHKACYIEPSHFLKEPSLIFKEISK